MTAVTPNRDHRDHPWGVNNYFYSTTALKSRLLRDLRRVFSRYAGWAEIVPYIRDSYALKEKPQVGVILKDVSGSYLPLSADDMVGSYISHVLWSRLRDRDSGFIAWILEDEENILASVELDVSSQVTGANSAFTLDHSAINPKTGEIDLNPAFTEVRVDGRPLHYFDTMLSGGGKQITLLREVPDPGQQVVVRYWRSTIAERARYDVELISEDSFVVTSFPMVNGHVVTASYNGETTLFDLGVTNLVPQTIKVYRDPSANRVRLIDGQHYTVDSSSGVLTLLEPLQPVGSEITMDYTRIGVESEPFPYSPGSSNNTAIPGVLIAFSLDGGAPRGQMYSNQSGVGIDGDSERVRRNPKIAVFVLDSRLDVGDVYGGRQQLSVSFDVYARDTMTRDQLQDKLANVLRSDLKPIFDSDGIHVGSPTMGGSGTDAYMEGGDLYHTGSISCEFETDWERIEFCPIRISEISLLLQSANHLTDDQLSQENVGLVPVFPLPPAVDLRDRNFERFTNLSGSPEIPDPSIDYKS